MEFVVLNKKEAICVEYQNETAICEINDFVLMICTFSIGYTEYAVMGILTSIADDFHIHVSSAGMLVTAYAASVCLTYDRNHYRG